ncbi:hypothetical protein BU15DRAFT_46934, partial [Melanogaster broomeanus]
HSPARKLLPQCSVCNKKFSTPVGLLSHQQAKRHLPCPTCSRNFTSPEQLAQHQSDAHGARDIHRCSECEARFNSRSELEIHGASHRKIPCSKCNRLFSSLIEWNNHFKQEHQKIQCSACKAVFTSEAVLASHGSYYAEHHPVVECDICHHACGSQTDLDVHIVTVHSCPICHDGIYMDTKTLEDHLEEHRAPYRCPSCGIAYTEEDQLLQHYKDSPNDVHPLCEKCGIGFQNNDAYTKHVEEAHPRIACDTCDGALFDQDELPSHYLSSRKHPKCGECGIGFRDRFDFSDVSAKHDSRFLPLNHGALQHGGSEHPETHCYLCQWQFDSPDALRSHIRHFVNHPKCVDCGFRFADADAYQHHLFVTHRPSFGGQEDPESLAVAEQDHNGKGDSDDRSSPMLGPRAGPFDPQWGFEGSASLPYASFIPLPPSLSGYSSPTSQRITGSSVRSASSGSHSRSSTLSVEQRFPTDGSGQQWKSIIQPFNGEQTLGGSLEFNDSPLSTLPFVGTPVMSSTQTIPSVNFCSPFSPRPETPSLFPLSHAVNGAALVNHDGDDDSSSSIAHSPQLISPVVKLPDAAAASPSSTTSGWTTSTAESKGSLHSHSTSSSKGMTGSYAIDQTASEHSIPQLSLLVPSATQPSVSASSISPESAGVSVAASMTPDYLREARAYLSITHPTQGGQSSPPASHSPGISSPILSSTGLASGERGHRREVRFEDNIISESVWDRQSTSSDSSLDPPASLPRSGSVHFRRNGAPLFCRFSPLVS